jgi:hypothetical protein
MFNNTADCSLKQLTDLWLFHTKNKSLAADLIINLKEQKP